MEHGFVYILFSSAMPDVVKIGHTSGSSDERARQISADTGVLVPFVVAYEEPLLHHEEAERDVHRHLEQFRVNRKREFFRMPLKDAIQVLREIAPKYRERERAEIARAEADAAERADAVSGRTTGADGNPFFGLGAPTTAWGYNRSRSWLKSWATFGIIFLFLAGAFLAVFHYSGLVKVNAPLSNSSKSKGDEKDPISTRRSATIDDEEEKPKPKKKINEDEPPQPKPGTLVLRTKTPVINGVEAWVEINGKRAAEWEVGATEVRLSLPAGKYQVAVFSIYQKARRSVFDKQITLSVGNESTVEIGPQAPAKR